MEKSKKKARAKIEKLWPTYMLSCRYPAYKKENAELVNFIEEVAGEGFDDDIFVSKPDLLKAYDHKSLHKLADFIKEKVLEVASEANAKVWDSDCASVKINILWFQIQNKYRYHPLHTHGNCSWTGVYYVMGGDADNEGGKTNFVGPYVNHAVYSEYGNKYINSIHHNVAPQDGKLVIFPPYLAHMSTPYNGKNHALLFPLMHPLSG